MTAAAAIRNARIPFRERHLVYADREGPRDGELAPRAFPVDPAFLVGRQAYDKNLSYQERYILLLF